MKTALKIIPLALACFSANAWAGDGIFDNLNIGNNALIGTAASKGTLSIAAPTGTAATVPSLKVTGDGGFWISSGSSSSLAPVYLGGGAGGFFFYPAKSALRIGSYLNISSTAGIGSFVLGGGTATGTNAMTIGTGVASGAGAVVIGNGTASGTQSVAIGGAPSAWGNESLTIGSGGSGGTKSVAFGLASYATGQGAFAAGNSSMAPGDYSVAFGTSTATGLNAFSAGLSSTAQAAYSVVFGRYNLLEGDPATWVATDPLFVIGNGTATAQRSNAFVVYKNGDIKIPKAQGDILMGEFGN